MNAKKDKNKEKHMQAHHIKLLGAKDKEIILKNKRKTTDIEGNNDKPLSDSWILTRNNRNQKTIEAHTQRVREKSVDQEVYIQRKYPSKMKVK